MRGRKYWGPPIALAMGRKRRGNRNMIDDTIINDGENGDGDDNNDKEEEKDDKEDSE